MLALVKTPPIELSLKGEGLEDLLDWIGRKYEVSIVSKDEYDEGIPVESTVFWREMEGNRIGNLLAGARHKAGLTQAELARVMGIKQSMISDFERGRREVSESMAQRLGEALGVKAQRFTAKPVRGDEKQG